MKKRHQLRSTLLALGLCAALLCGFLAGCQNNTPGGDEDETTLTPPAEDTGLVLNLYQPHQSQTTLWEALAADYKNLTGVTLVVHTPKTTDAAVELKEALKGEENAPGLFLFTNPREYKAWQDNAADLRTTTAYQHLADHRLALTADEKIVGIPLGVEAFGLIYNQKILSAYFALEDKDTAFTGIDSIKNHKDLEDLAKDMDAHKSELGIDGVFASPALKAGESAAWGTRLMSVPMGYEMEKKNISVTGDEINELGFGYDTGYKGFYALHTGYGTAAEGFDARSYADAAKEFATGKAAMILGSTDFVGLLNSAVGQSVAAEDCAFLPAYMNIEDYPTQGLAFETVLYAAVNGHANEEETRAADEFLNWLVTSEKGTDFLASKLNVIAPYDSESSAALTNNALAANALTWLKKEGVTNAVTWSVLTPGDEYRDEVVGTGLVKYTKGESAWDEFRADLAAGWKKHRERMNEDY